MAQEIAILEIKGTEKLRSALKDLLEDTQRNIPKILRQAGHAGVALCKIECPVDTGRLKESIGNPTKEGIFDVTRNAVVFGTAVDYAFHVEFGHRTRLKKPTPGKKSFVKGRYYMLRGVQKAVPLMIDILKGVIKVEHLK